MSDPPRSRNPSSSVWCAWLPSTFSAPSLIPHRVARDLRMSMRVACPARMGRSPHLRSPLLTSGSEPRLYAPSDAAPTLGVSDPTPASTFADGIASSVAPCDRLRVASVAGDQIDTDAIAAISELVAAGHRVIVDTGTDHDVLDDHLIPWGCDHGIPQSDEGLAGWFTSLLAACAGPLVGPVAAAVHVEVC